MKDRDVDQAVRDLVREDVDLPEDGLDRALAIARQTPQVRRRRWWPFGRVRRDPSATETDRELTATTTLIGGRVPLVGLGAAATFVVVVAFMAGTQFGDDEAAIVPAASGAPTPTVAAPSCVPSAGGPSGPCPLIGSADITNTTRLRRTVLPIRTVGAEFSGPGEPFYLLYENEANELEIRGIAEPGLYQDDARFLLGAGTTDVGIDTADGSDCVVMITFVDAWSLSGGFSCEDHAAVVDESPNDISGAFEVSIAERGAASAYRSDSYSEGWGSEMFGYDSAMFFDGRLESMTAEFPDGPMRLSYRSEDGSTMEVTGTTGEGSFTEDDGFSIVIDDGGSEYLDLDPGNSDCTIEVERSEESGIEADFDCRFVGRSVGGSFKAIP